MPKKIAWVVPSPLKGSGGLGVIYSRIQLLIDNGYEVHTYLDDNRPPNVLSGVLTEYYGRCESIVHSGWEITKKFDLVFATIWNSPRIINTLSNVGAKAYFVQDYEPMFHPIGDNYLTAEYSYRYGLKPVVYTRWLLHKLTSMYGTPCYHFDFCIDHDIYFQMPKVNKEFAICYMYQPEKPRRCGDIGVKALEMLKKEFPDITLYLYGNNAKTPLPFEYVDLGILKPNQLNELYNKCIAGLSISASNPSLIPFEMMGVGLPVVDIYRENNLYDFPDSAVLLANPTPQGIKNSLALLLTDKSRIDSMTIAGHQFMKHRNAEWEESHFLDIVERLISGEADPPIAKVNRIYNHPPIF